MTDWFTFLRTQLTAEGAIQEEPARLRILRFNRGDDEYRAASARAGLVDRSNRGLLEVSGQDRTDWLQNMVTNEVKNLQIGQGIYAFATNNKGRILFDLNVLVGTDSFWLDIDQRFLATAMTHLEKYIIIEDVSLHDRSDGYHRLGLVGPEAPGVLRRLGVADAGSMSVPGMSELKWRDLEIALLRSDFCGLFGVELFVPPDRAADLWNDLCDASEPAAAVPIGDEAVEILRMESGIPWPGCEITDDVLPAETVQLDRAVSYTKGCYLGQEVIERMRTRGGLARRLVGVSMEGSGLPARGAAISLIDGTVVGRLTSTCRSAAGDCFIGLGYVKTGSAGPGTKLRVSWDDGSVDATIAELPFITREKT